MTYKYVAKIVLDHKNKGEEDVWARGRYSGLIELQVPAQRDDYLWVAGEAFQVVYVMHDLEINETVCTLRPKMPITESYRTSSGMHRRLVKKGIKWFPDD